MQIAQTKDIIQLGIQYDIKSFSSKHKHNLRMKDFKMFNDTEFKYMIDNNYTPAVYYPGFFFTTYASCVFHYFRDLFEIQKDYLQNLSYNTPLRALSDPGDSKSIFYLTQDGKFIIKSLQSAKFQSIRKLLPKYRLHMEENPRSLLPKFSGLYGYKCNTIDMKLVSMINLLPSNIKMHLKYDLKGSTYKRTASRKEKLKPSPTFKDLDFDDEYLNNIFLMPNTLSDLLKTINNDIDFLKKLNKTNYSLLLGIHFIDEGTSNCSQAASARFNRLMVDSIGMESIQEDAESFPKENCPSLRGSIPAKSGSGRRMLLFVGIIDILEEYGALKKIENTYKTLTIELTPGFPPDVSSISVQPPDAYATRFIEFMTNFVFKPILTNEELGARSKQSFKAGSSKRLNDDDFDDTSCISCFKRKKSSRNTINKNDLN
ncbi:phosphatidylinositol 4-phosphate 5-kinase type-1 beta-like [Myzus persicae]|uniref:phosphatidylinositol 4-phosphate 5-kinase type-1 beta-like n=1 Tax=Myzus persicae TaxID=13164 RepID=UPI000B93807D|nr:phosphatidylinositol 4-phosphate 5-kinase type-1 beta-like [Myzus persicae]